MLTKWTRGTLGFLKQSSGTAWAPFYDKSPSPALLDHISPSEPASGLSTLPRCTHTRLDVYADTHTTQGHTHTEGHTDTHGDIYINVRIDTHSLPHKVLGSHISGSSSHYPTLNYLTLGRLASGASESPSISEGSGEMSRSTLHMSDIG